MIQISVPDLINSVGSVLNVVLTGALIYIYIQLKRNDDERVSIKEQQTAIQSRQTEILENQERLMKAEYQPLLRIHDRKVETEDGDEIFVFSVSNEGNSAISSITLETKLFTLDSQPDDDTDLMSTVDEGGVMIPVENMIDGISSTRGTAVGLTRPGTSDTTVIAEGGSEDRLESYPKISFHKNEEYFELRFDEIQSFFSNEGIDPLVIQWEVKYRNMVGHEKRKYVTTVAIAPGDQVSLEEAVSEYQTYPIMQDGIMRVHHVKQIIVKNPPDCS